MTVLLKEAIKPNLIQTLEGQPCLMHCGPFANIAHGNSSLVADKIGLKLGEYVITESGFGSDMGMEKLFDIVCRGGGLTPSAVVLVCTVRALKHHGGLEDDPRVERAHAMAAIEKGAANLRRHLGIVARVRSALRRRDQPPARRHRRRSRARSRAVARVRRVRGRGQRRLRARRHRCRGPRPAVVDACEQPSEFRMMYEDEDPIVDKITAVAKRVYGAKDVFLYPDAERKIAQFTADGLGHLPICMAKTHLSLSADPSLLGAPENFTLPVRDIRAYTGAGWLVPLCGDITQMPGLGKTPAALNVDIDADGRTVGLF